MDIIVTEKKEEKTEQKINEKKEEKFDYEHVLAYKNGKSFFVKKILLPANKTEIVITKPESDEIGYGTFWVYANGNYK
jgi:hypothetical protein